MPVVFFSSLNPLHYEGRCDPGTYVVRETDNQGVLQLITIDGKYTATLHCTPAEVSSHPAAQFTYYDREPLPRLHRIMIAGKPGWEIQHSYQMLDGK